MKLLAVSVALLGGFSVLKAQNAETERGPRAGAERKERPAAEGRERPGVQNRERAQQERPQRPERGQQAERRPVIEELGLSTEQREQMRVAMQENQAAMRALRADQSVTAEDRRAKAMELREAHQAKLRTILTAEQFAKLQEARERGGENRRGPAAPGGAEARERRGPPADGEARPQRPARGENKE